MNVTGTLVRLKLTLLRNGLRRSVWKIVGLVIGSLYGLFVVGSVVVGLVALRFADPTIASSVTTVVFAVVTIAWILLPLLVFGQDDTVDPSRFALLPVPARALLPGLTLSAFLSIPGVATVLAALGLFGTWSTSVATMISCVLVIPIGLVLCVLWSRTVLTWMAALLSGRRTRDFSVVLVMVLLLGFALGAQFLSRMLGDPEELLAGLHRAAAIVSWTPFGWIWAVPGQVASGHWVGAVVRLVLSVALVAGLARLWRVRLDAALTAPPVVGEERAVRGAGGLARLLPATPAGAVALRCLLYWRRDPRYLMALVSLLLTPLLLGVVAVTSGGSALTPWLGLFITWLIGSSVTSELAYDSSALGLHALTGMSGADDRLGRTISYLIIGAPLALLAVIGGTMISGEVAILPRVLALAVASLLGGLGFGLWLGTRIPGKAPKPGSNPLSSGESGGLKTLLVFALTSVGNVVTVLPTAALVIASFVGPDWLQWVALVVGAVTGVLALRWGIRAGGRVLDNRWPELLAEVS
ncbi:hypothetical protein ACQBAR_01075 [Propionibacteriaceae bacterium Y1685]